MGVAILATTGGSLAGTGSTATSVTPVQALRIAAQCGGRRSYVPGWTPVGFHLSAWTAISHNIPCDYGLRLRFFHRGSSELTWDVGSPRAYSLPCKSRALVFAHLDGRTIFRRVGHGVEEVWACLRTGYRPPVLASQSTGRAAASTDTLVRMVATAHVLPAGRSRGARFKLVPPADVRRLRRVFSSPFYLPARLPAGFVYSESKMVRRDYDVGDRDALFAVFGRDGLVLDWGVYAGRDTFGLDCPSKKTRLAPEKYQVIDGVQTFLRVGIHGGTAWRCVRAHSVGNARPLEVELWYDIRLDTPAFRRQISEIVAQAQLVEAG